MDGHLWAYGLLMMNRDLGMNAIRLEGKLQVNEI